MDSKYHAVDRSSSEEDDFDEAVGRERPSQVTIRMNHRRLTVFILTFLFMWSTALVMIARWTFNPSELQCAKRVSPWSSMWDAVEFWEGDLRNEFNHSTIYRGPPTPEREKAWDELWRHPDMPVSEAGIAALNKTGQADFVEREGSDPNAPEYAAIVHVFHQLHCLNTIRKYTWFLTGNYHENDTEIEYPKAFEDALVGRMHVDHCLETLRLDLMCYGDITPVLNKHDPNRGVGRVPDYDMHRQCRKFDSLVNWINIHGVSSPWPAGISPPTHSQ